MPEVICSGVGGDTTQMMAARLEPTVLAYDPHTVFFSREPTTRSKG